MRSAAAAVCVSVFMLLLPWHRQQDCGAMRASVVSLVADICPMQEVVPGLLSSCTPAATWPAVCITSVDQPTCCVTLHVRLALDCMDSTLGLSDCIFPHLRM